MASRPPFTPHLDEVSRLRHASVEVDCSTPVGTVPPLWAAVGYDEINWTYTGRGQRLLAELRADSPHPFHIRTHYLFCSGTGLSLPHWGSGNVYQQDDQGRSHHDFTIADQVFDAIVAAGHVPLVELGFTPRALVDEHDLEGFPWQASATEYGRYESSGWSYPPKDLDAWHDLVAGLVAHCLERYGRDEVAGWRWELWNEPDIFYWRGTDEQFHELYTVTTRAVRGVLPEAKVGGPATTGDPSGPAFLEGFLRHCEQHELPLDFVSFHTKGCYLRPSRVYGPVGGPAPQLQSPSSLKMLREVRDSLAVMEQFDLARGLPAVVDECDASVPAHLGAYDNANYGYRNSEYFPVFQCKLMKKLLDLDAVTGPPLAMAMIWGFYFEGVRWFEGFRELVTNDDVAKPVLNAYRMLAHLHPQRLRATCDAAWPLDDLDGPEAGMPEEVDVLATTDGQGRLAVLVWRHADDQYLDADGDVEVALRLTGLPVGAGSAGSAVLRHLRIDREHSNSHSVWQAMGAPQEPTTEQRERLHARSGLEEAEPPRRVDLAGGELTLELRLPLPSVSLVTLDLDAD